MYIIRILYSPPPPCTGCVLSDRRTAVRRRTDRGGVTPNFITNDILEMALA